MEKIAYIYYFREIANVKSVQKENFSQYLKTICNFEQLYSNHFTCLANNYKEYVTSFEEENQRKCTKEFNEMKNCEYLRKALIKGFKERQKKFIQDVYVHGKKLD